MRFCFFVVVMVLIFFSCNNEQENPLLPPIQSQIVHKKPSSPSATKNVYFGDLHVHTGWSFDAYVSNVRVTPDQAYLFGKGEAIPHVSGTDIQMKRPLDFMAVSDHAEYMGALIQMSDESSNLYDLGVAKQIRSEDRRDVIKAMRKIQLSIAMNWPNKKLIQKENLKSTWERMVEIADNHYDPGKFTTFPAYEWTSSPAAYGSLIVGPRYARNLHRNVIYKGGKVSAIPFSSFDSQDPEDLWEWMETQRQQGIDLFAIPHNANISNGMMYALSKYDGGNLDEEYVKTRIANEPVNEVVQIKGQSMSHPILAPNDEFSEFEVFPYALGQGEVRKELEPEGSYVREAFKNGLLLEEKYGTNPFQFGIIGSSDSHNGGPNVEEDNNIGKSGIKDHTPKRRLDESRKGGPVNRRWSVAGLAAVWAEQNTREAIYEAFLRKEVYATSGPRMKVKFYANETWGNANFNHENWDSIAYEKGVPMGGELNRYKKSPEFIISAVKDPDGANLDRIQVIKGWVDSDKNSREKIYNVAWSGDRKIDKNGLLAPVGNTVNVNDATYTNDIGAIRLQTIWADPDFNPTESAFYYVRVLEIPTPRWTTYDAVAIGAPLPQDVPFSIQERAWTSPIWYKGNDDD